MITVICAYCGHELNEPGGLLISPPGDSLTPSVQVVSKAHLCKSCYRDITVIVAMGR